MRKDSQGYGTYGNVAYAPERDVYQPKQPNRSVKTYSRPKIKVREPGAIAPFAVAGFAAVVVLAQTMLGYYAQLAVSSDQLVQLNKQIQDAQKQTAILQAQYEKTFDTEYLQNAVGDIMVRPTSQQIVYIDLSRVDDVTLHDSPSGWEKLFG